MICKKCGKELTQEMIDANLCWSCGDIINESIAEKDIISNSTTIENEPHNGCYNVPHNKNKIGHFLKFIGIIILIFGSIASFVLAGGGRRNYNFVLPLFIIYEFATISVAFLFIGFSEIIRLLDNINNKL